MPEKLIQATTEWREAIAQALLFGTIGVLTALGQLMASKEVLTWRIVVGRCLSTAGIATASGAVLLAFPAVPPIAQIGVAAALASLGTSGLERVIQRALGIGQGG
jgi:drug/metabolite transporter (DMT)-like permease